MKKILAIAAVLLFASTGFAQITVSVTEVHSTGSSNSTYARDWFELTNFGAAPVDITGWTMDDNSASFLTSVPLSGITTINPGQSVAFIETGDLATNGPIFAAAWFGGDVPASFVVASYNGSGVGLSSAGDQVNIFDAGGTLITTVTFGAATAGVSFDNAAGLTGSISTLSQVGVNGAFTSFAGSEIGSPGVIAAAVPEPASLMLIGTAICAFAGRRLLRKKAK